MGFSKSKQSSTNNSQQTSSSSNQAFPFLLNSFGGATGNFRAGTDALSSLLGLNGDTSGVDAFNRFRDSSGYDFIRNEGVRGIEAGLANRGQTNSGAALKSLSRYNSGLANNFLESYIGSLMGLSNSGLQAGQLLAGAGGVSNSQGTSTGTSKGSSFGLTSN